MTNRIGHHGGRWWQVVGATILTMLLCGSVAHAESRKFERIEIEYVVPTNIDQRPLYDFLTGRQVLERVRNMLASIRWPRAIRLVLRGCDGKSRASYEDAVITVCYEYLEGMLKVSVR